MFNLFTEHRVNATNEQAINNAYKYWRLRVMYSMYIGYAIFYFTRKGFIFILPQLMNDLHFTKSEIGLFGTIFYFTYGVSKFIFGMVSDKSNPRYFMAFGLIMTGITNILFGFSSSLVVLLCLWFVNAVFQGWGWPPCAKYLTHWFSQKERGLWWGLWNTSHLAGSIVVPLLAGLIASYWGWRSAMVICGICAILVGIFLLNRLCGTPEEMGLPPIEIYKNDNPDNSAVESKRLPTNVILKKYILTNKYLWLLALSYMLVYFIQTTFVDWGALYLTQKGYSLISADSCLSFFEAGGFGGSLAAGIWSDKIFKGRRGPINILFCLSIFIFVLLFWLMPSPSYSLHALTAFLVGFFVFGPQMLLGVAAAELSYREAAGTATGFLALFAYTGAAFSGYPIGLMVQLHGWAGFFIAMCVCSIASTLLLLPLWPVTSAAKN